MIVNSNPITATLPTSGRTLANRNAIRIDIKDIITPIGILKNGRLIIFINLLGAFNFGLSIILTAINNRVKSDSIEIIVR